MTTSLEKKRKNRLQGGFGGGSREPEESCTGWHAHGTCVTTGNMHKLEGKYSLESTYPRESEIRAPPQPLPYLMPIPPTRFCITNSTY